MPSGSPRCSICRCAEPSPQRGGLCEPCADEHHPPIERRGGRLSPLTVGALSHLFDVFFVPGLIAMQRSFAELRTVREREAFGLWRAEHPRVRAEAAWGITLGAGRIALVAVSGLAVLIAAGLPRPPEPMPPTLDELGEVLDDLTSGEAMREAVALRQLPHVLHGARQPVDLPLRAPSAREGAPSRPATPRKSSRISSSPRATRTLLRERDPSRSVHQRAVSDTRPLERSLEAILTLDEPELQARAARVALSPPGVPWTPRIEALTLALHADAAPANRSRLLRLLADARHIEALTRALHLHAADRAPLAELADLDPINAAMLRLPGGHPYRAHGAERFAARCSAEHPAPPEVQANFESAVEYALEQVEAASVESRVPRLQHAVALVAGLACLSRATALARLEAAAHSDEPRVAVAALVALHVPERHRARLHAALRDPMARAYWHRRSPRPIPIGFRTRDAITLAEAAAALEEAGHRCHSPQLAHRTRYPQVSELAHRWQCDDGFERLTYSAPLAPRTARWQQRCASALLGYAKSQRRARVMFWPPSRFCAGSPHVMPPLPSDPIIAPERCDAVSRR